MFFIGGQYALSKLRHRASKRKSSGHHDWWCAIRLLHHNARRSFNGLRERISASVSTSTANALHTRTFGLAYSLKMEAEMKICCKYCQGISEHRKELQHKGDFFCSLTCMTLYREELEKRLQDAINANKSRTFIPSTFRRL